MSVADPKIIDPVPRIQLRGQPARLLTTAGSSLGMLTNFNLTGQGNTTSFANVLIEQNGVFYVAKLLGSTGVSCTDQCCKT
jgi:hypothetical protein